MKQISKEQVEKLIKQNTIKNKINSNAFLESLLDKLNPSLEEIYYFSDEIEEIKEQEQIKNEQSNFNR